MTLFNRDFQFLTLNRISLIKKRQLYQFDLINTCYFKMMEFLTMTASILNCKEM